MCANHSEHPVRSLGRKQNDPVVPEVTHVLTGVI